MSVVPSNLPTASEVVDVSSADHAFTAFPDGVCRMLRVVGAAGGGAVTVRLADDDADLALPIGEGVEYMGFAIKHVRTAGTSGTTSIIGFA